ncbi:addiction module killer protein [Betaproteobacteria bacterium]|nr:addiction module killer protein [Betaproteobacteria bacterium]
MNDNINMFELCHYLTETGKDLFDEWLRSLVDMKAKAAIIRRLHRMEAGNFGDYKPLQEGVYELRIDVGVGYRVYYARSGKVMLLLLAGGDKRTQSADIARAVEYWQQWKTKR